MNHAYILSLAQSKWNDMKVIYAMDFISPSCGITSENFNEILEMKPGIIDRAMWVIPTMKPSFRFFDDISISCTERFYKLPISVHKMKKLSSK